MSIKHYILTLDPSAKYEWDRCTLHDPLTGKQPDLAELIATALGSQPVGSYLVALNLDVQVLEQAPPLPQRPLLPPTAELGPEVVTIPTRAAVPEWVA